MTITICLAVLPAWITLSNAQAVQEEITKENKSKIAEIRLKHEQDIKEVYQAMNEHIKQCNVKFEMVLSDLTYIKVHIENILEEHKNENRK